MTGWRFAARALAASACAPSLPVCPALVEPVARFVTTDGAQCE